MSPHRFPSRHSSAARFARGFTFVELVISLVVIAIAVIGVLMVYTTTVASSADPLIRQQALAIAEAYLDEVVSKHYSDPDGVDGEASRDQYDDVDDYAGFSAAPSRPDGSTAGLASLAAYTVTITVGAPVAIGPGGNQATARQVTVSVDHGGTTVASLWSYRTDYGP